MKDHANALPAGPPERIAILGMGLIGGSISKDVHGALPHCEVYAIGHTEDVESALGTSLLTGKLEYDELHDMDMVIIATPLDVIRSAAAHLSAKLGKVNRDKPIIVLDVGSVKEDITNDFEKLTRQTHGVEFVSTHPMAGTEFQGFAHARKHLFRRKPWLICPHNENSQGGIARVEAFTRLLDARPGLLDAEEHDQKSALISHSVIALSNLLFDFICQEDPSALELAGSGFDSTTRLASGNVALHESIMELNGQYVERYLHAFAQFLASTKVDNLDRAFFVHNQERRNAWLHNRPNS